MIMRLFLAIAVLLCAAQATAGEVTVSGAWVRATAPGQDSAAVSLNISSAQDARIVAVSSPAAERVEIHTMKHEHDMMMMRQVETLALPAKKEIALGHGDHLMLLGLKQPLKAGDNVSLKLTVEFADKRREVIEAKAEVRPLTASHEMHDMGGMRHDY